MTTTTLSTATSAHTPGPLERVVRVARLILVNKSTMFVTPLLILAIIFLATLSIWWVISATVPASELEGSFVGGGSSFVVIYMLVAAVQAINLTFRFAQGYSVTRRDFYLGSALAFLGISVGYAVLLGVLGWIENVTGGWGTGGQMFSLYYLGLENPFQTFYVYFMALLFFTFIGMAIATLYVRWRMYGLLGFFTGLTFLIVGLVALFTLTRTWSQVGAWFAANGAVGVATWLLVPAVIAGVIGFFILKKATPGN